MKGALRLWTRVLLSVGALGYVLWWVRHDLRAAWQLAQHIAWWAVPGSVLCYLISVVLVAQRLRQVVSAYGVRVSLAASTRLSMIGLFCNNFLPTGFGGDLVKAHYMARLSGRSASSYWGVVVDRLFGVMTIALLGLLAVAGYRGLALNRSVMLVGLVSVSGGTWVLWRLAMTHGARWLDRLLARWPWLARVPALAQLPELLQHGTFTTRRTLGVLLISVIVQLFTVLAVFVLIQGLGLAVSLSYLFMVTPLIWSLSLLPSINGLGLREGAFVCLLGGVAGREGAFALSIVWLGVITTVSLLGAVAYLASHGPQGGLVS